MDSFQGLFKTNFVFKHFSRLPFIFKYFSSLCEPWSYCHTDEKGQTSTSATKVLAEDWLCWDLMTRQLLWVILCCLPEKGRKETEEIVEKTEERDREKKRPGMKVKKQKK